ncbi:MAG: ion transporter, partial [Promethearchaeia archaeon]
GGVLAAVPDGHWASNMEATFVVTGQIFSALFTLECLIKIFGLGFFLGHHSYLADKSNYLDFFIVILGILDFIPSSGDDEGGGNLSALRALRVLRPLKAVTKFPELKFIVVLLLQCLPKLASVLQICLFIFFVFGILGVQLFKGVLRKRCFDVNNGENSGDLCGGMRTCYGYGTDTDDASFLTLRRTPSKYAGCLSLGENSGRGAINFDYIGGAVTTIFQTMTQEGWADIMYELSDTDHQLGGHVWVYFVILIVIGPWLAVNLFMVVISVQYDENMHLVQQAEKRLKEERLKLEHAVREQVLSCPFCHGASCEECDPDGVWHEMNHSVHASVVGSSFGDGGLLRDTSTVTVGPCGRLQAFRRA